MSDLNDYQFRRRDELNPDLDSGGRSRTIMILGGLVAVVLVALGWYYFAHRSSAPESASGSPELSAPSPATPSPPLGAEPEDVDVPALPESDPLVRTLVRTMSSHPVTVRWLATDGLIRNFTVVVDNIANGKSPARQIQALKPSGSFTAQGTADALRVDPASFQRYDDLAAAVDSVDAQAAARVYSTLKPRIEEASRELGNPQSFDETLEKALVRLLRTPVDAQEQLLRPKGAEGYQYVDPKYEGLSSAQKLLIRMGPRNARMVQNKLREIALALGIPPDHLPS
jgi:Protein of unknown function (DUF3014)